MRVNRLRVLGMDPSANSEITHMHISASGPMDFNKGVPIEFTNSGNTTAIVWSDGRNNVGAPFGFTMAEIQPGQTFRAPWADLVRPAFFPTNSFSFLDPLWIVFQPARFGSPLGNRLVAVRSHLEAGKQIVTMEARTQSGELVPNCFSLQLLNQGQNTAMVGEVSLPPGNALELRGEPGHTLTSPLAIVFNDGLTGLEVVDEFPLLKTIRMLGFDPMSYTDTMVDDTSVV